MPLTDEVILAIDQGTSSTKVLLVGPDGEVLARSSIEVGSSHPRPGWAEQSATEIWSSVQDGVRACVPAAMAERVVAVGLSTQRESLVLWERASGAPLGPLISWQDRRTAAACADLERTGVGEDVWTRSGLPLDPMFSALKARWMLDTYDADRARSRRGELCLGTVDSWLLSRLDGGHVTDASNASRTQLFNIEAGNWDPELLTLFNVPVEVLPHVVASTGPFPVVRGMSPVPDGVPVLAVLGDSHAALFAHAGWREGVVKATYGTGSSVMAVGAAGVSRSVCRTIAWDVGSGPVHAVEGNIRSTGRTLTWLAEVLGTTAEDLALEGAGSGSGGVHIVPAFGGLAAPWWQPDAVSVIAGATLATTRAHLAAAALESVALQVEDVVAAIEDATGTLDTLLADGGMTRNDHLMQLQADLSGRSVSRAAEADLSALGVADLAGVVAGGWDLSDLESRDRGRTNFRPQITQARRIERVAAWHEAVERARPPARRLSAPQHGLSSEGVSL